MKLKRILLDASLVIVGWVVVTSVAVLFLYARPRRSVSPVRPSDFGLAYEEVLLRTSDGVDLRGWYLPREGRGEALCVLHGYPFDKGDVLHRVRFLAPDHNILLFDWRAMGESGGAFTTFGFREREDLKASLDWLEEKGFDRVGVLGYSMGGSVALLLQDPRAACIVSEGAFASLDGMVESIFRHLGVLKRPFVLLVRLLPRVFLGVDPSEVSPVKAVEGTKTPTLLVHGGKDLQVSPRNAEAIHASAGGEGSPVEPWIVPGAGYGEVHLVAGEEYERRVRKFLRKHLKNRKSSSTNFTNLH